MKITTKTLRKLIKESTAVGQYLVIVGDNERHADEVEIFGFFNSSEEIINAIYPHFSFSNNHDTSDEFLKEAVIEQMTKALNKRNQIDSYLSEKFWKVFKL